MVMHFDDFRYMCSDIHGSRHTSETLPKPISTPSTTSPQGVSIAALHYEHLISCAYDSLCRVEGFSYTCRLDFAE